MNLKYLNKINTRAKLFLIFLIPLLFFIVFGLILDYKNLIIYSYDLLLIEIIFFHLVLLFRNNKLKFFLYSISYVIICSYAIFKLGFFHIFKNNFNASNVFIILETNLSESKEFIHFYFDSFIWFLILFYFLSFLLSIYLSYNKFKKLSPYSLKRFVYKTSIILFTCLLLFLNKQENLFFIFYREYNEYKHQLSLNNKDLSSQTNNYFSNVNFNNDSLTAVIVIGESVNRNHMKIYDYKRNTTPYMYKIKNDLYLFKNVISSNCNTIRSLFDALTLNENNKKIIKNASLIQLFNMAGFETYWISNQKPIGIHETTVSTIAKACKKKYFLNSSHNNENTPHDNVVLHYYNQVLKEKKPRKIIFIHLLGSHTIYEKRYPEKFNVFNAKNTSRKNSLINSYDNSILYTDFILNKIINPLKNKNITSFLLYFSDHGEEIYESVDFFGHTDDIGSKNMYEIPYVLWLSSKKKKQIPYNLKPLLNRKIINDNLIYSIADLSNLKFDQQNLTKSNFSLNFKEKKRLIRNNSKDYDKVFNSK